MKTIRIPLGRREVLLLIVVGGKIQQAVIYSQVKT